MSANNVSLNNGHAVGTSHHHHADDDPVTSSSVDAKDNRPKKQRRKKKKGSEAAAAAAGAAFAADASNVSESEFKSQTNALLPDDVEIEYVPDTSIILSHLARSSPADADASAPTADGGEAHGNDDAESQSESAPSLADYFGSIFAKFEAAASQDADGDVAMADADGQPDQPEDGLGQSDSESDDDNAEGKEMSNRKLRRAARLTVAELKQLVDKPEAVEWVDVTASDPKLLIDIKSTRNTIPVPVHWSQKRKYLQNKRGLEKSAFQLPEFILATGILEMRESIDKDGTKLKQKTRERVQPKMGKLVIDYGKLHAAFFKWQTKPELTSYGDVYFEGKEFEAKLKHVRPGAPLSDALREALGMPQVGTAPPPFLFNMQRYGPPPSYPGLKIPGLNAPIPPGCMWGFHPGGWGKPPVDEYGRPLYGDVYGQAYDPMMAYRDAANAWRGGLWGEMERRGDDSDSDEDMDQDSDDDEIASEDEPMDLDAEHPAQSAAKEEAITSFGPGAGGDDDEMEMELQEYVAELMAPPTSGVADATGASAAYASGYTTETPLPPRELYTVVGESASQSAAARGTMMGSDVVYDIRRRQAPGTETETPMTAAGGSADEQAKRRQREMQQRERERERQQQQASGTQSSRGAAGQGQTAGRQRREFKF